jgi:hypothetical protein
MHRGFHRPGKALAALICSDQQSLAMRSSSFVEG